MGYEGRYPTNEEYANYTQEDRVLFEKDYYRGAYAHAGMKPKFKDKVKYKLGTAFAVIIYPLALLLMFVILNVVVVGGQELWHLKQKNELKSLQVEMENTKEIIASYEIQVNNGTISDPDYAIYSKQIDLYNEDVQESNNLNEKIGSTWYIIPIPHGK